MLDVIVIMQKVRVDMGHIAVSVLMGVLLHRLLSLLAVRSNADISQ
ncbi:MAG: hypothetical protein M3228_03100 [Actinomycetota bacterium]|nr:hypothetical protein [Actinomycetota bacterium]